jgi:peptide deformylase
MGELKRAETVTAKWRDLSGKEVRIKAEGLLAQAIEHEIDHLNGQLYIDHMENLETLRKLEAGDTEI